MTVSLVSHYTGAAALLDDLPKAQWMRADRGYEADWCRDALQAKRMQRHPRQIRQTPVSKP
jgi:hypothetical protein